MNVITVKPNTDFPNFFCPVTGIKIYGDGAEGTAPTVKGMWDDATDEGTKLDRKIKKLWENWEENNPGAIREFLENLKAPDGWIAFEIEGGHNTDWVILNLNFAEEKED